MNKQKIKPLDEERESRSLLSNAVVILHLVFGTLPLLLVVWAVDRLMSDTLTSTAIWMVGAAMLLFALLRGVFYGTSIWRAHRSAYNALTRLRLRIVSHLQRLPLGFFQERKVGDLVNIINHDVEQIEIYLAHGLPEILSATLFPALLWVIVMVLDWRLGLSLISLLPLAFLLQMAVKTFWGKSFRHFMENTQKMSEDLLEYVATIPIIKAFSHEETRTERVLGGMRDYIHWVKRSMFSVTVPMTLITMFLEGGIVVMTLVGLRLMSSGELTVARFILALILGGLFSYSFAKLATFQHFSIVYGQSLAKVQSITEVPAKDTADRDTDAMQTDVCFEHVTFAYPNKKDCALCDVNLQFPKGSHTAIVGESGSGKSTLASLMMGFWQPQSGTVRLGGENLAELSEHNIADFFSMVQQEVFLFNTSIRDNIRIGKPSATQEEVETAARRARIHDFITGLPNGYDTLAGEAGVKFSGGEKQRISIARMLLKDSPIVILDEATAALDGENEKLIQEALDELQRNKTVITIAHRLNTIQDMERIVVMDKGKVVATGTHGELMDNCPLYRNMTETQERVSKWQLKEEEV
ncbi:ABC transporter ATP-binding protein [Prevotella intermedia]|uniref:ABC transporter ATP-binding protein n=1 Tax=Prevotella intermedia TaxID=28131 RepID=A0A2D3LIK6_PREIN|nr:ABC transporter ATP-binding protein [Prevotella intermedia]ATV30369.1 ABC transporter ATP-binding protein [Prevotella intermedia]PJI23382.1 ABC transporter ATP-binding protein [Prevotella intermedia]